MKTPIYYSVEEVAAFLRRSPRTIRDWIRHGCPTPDGPVRLDAAKLGRAWTIKDEWLVLFEHRVRPDRGRPELELD